MPKLCHGTEVMDVDADTMDKMETFHGGMAKHVQNLPNQCSNIGCLAAVGWENVREHCNVLKFIFLWQLLTLLVECLYKQIAITRLCLVFYTAVEHCGKMYRIWHW